MKASNQILECDKCKKASVRIDPINHSDLFNDCWLKVREIELKDDTWQPDNYISFFCRIMKNRTIDNQRANGRHEKHNVLWSVEQMAREEEIKDYTFDEFLIKWLDDKTDDEVENFYKEIIFLVLHNKTINGLVASLDMQHNTFYKHYNTAKQILKHDYITSTDNNIFFSSLLV